MNIDDEQHNPSKVDRRSSSSSDSSSSSRSSCSCTSTSRKSFRENSDDSIADPIYKSEDSSNSSEEENAIPSRIDVNRSKKIARKVKNPSNIENKGKKHVAKPEQWQKNLAKRARNSGTSYTSSSSSKKVFEERKLLPPCNDKCKLKCPTKITEDQRNLIFKDYWSLGDLQRQRDFLLSSISEIRPLYRYVRENRTRERSHNNAYYFEINHQKIRVCKTFFKATLSISDRPIRTILQKRTHFTNNIISAECRGKHGKHFKIDEKVKNGVRAHINSIPRIPSHYCRARTSREYIEGGKSLADIHRDYEQMCKDNNQQAANYMMFSRIFNQEFNISFFLPKKDQCEVCVAYSNSNDEEKHGLEEKYQIHLNEAKLARKEKEEDKSAQNTAVAVFDLQAVLPCPSGQASSFYYVSKLSVFNLTVFDLKTKEVQCFVWNEAEAQRGANEIGSCIMRYLNTIQEKIANGENPKEIDVIFFSDNCTGQQKNKFLIAAYMYTLSKCKYIRSITHKFLITGHSQNEGDNAHSVIERQISRAKKSGPVYTPEQYYSLIRCAKKTGTPYKVTEICYDDIYDLKCFVADVGWNSTVKSEEGDNFKLTDVKVLKVEKDHFGKIFYKTSYEHNEFKVLDVLKRKGTRNSSSNFDKIILKKAYKNRVGITEKKKKSLLSLFKNKAIPMSYFPFYNAL